ncbi:MAG: Hsp20/alpha crystallin family protein [Planctomycetota bacterium]|jgi:HSP20 family protein
MRIQRTHLRHPLASVPRRSSELTSAFDRLFDDVFQGALGRSQGTAGPRTPRFDLIEDEGGYQLVFELPGVDPEAVELRVEDGELRLQTRELEAEDAAEATAEAAPAEDAQEACAPTTRVLHRGRPGNAFAARLRLPEDVELDAVEAEHDLGLLTVRLPKVAAEAASRVVPVRRR